MPNSFNVGRVPRKSLFVILALVFAVVCGILELLVEQSLAVICVMRVALFFDVLRIVDPPFRFRPTGDGTIQSRCTSNPLRFFGEQLFLTLTGELLEELDAEAINPKLGHHRIEAPCVSGALQGRGLVL